MKLLGDALFNLMLNGVASFWLGVLMVALIGGLLRPKQASVRILLLLLPFLKLLWDFRSGIPGNSFFWASEQGVMQRLGSFQVGFGLHPWGPGIEGHLLAMHAGGQSPQSFADVLSRALRFRVSVYAASGISFAALLISVLKCAQRVHGYLAFRRHVQVSLAACVPGEWRAVGRRCVRIYTADTSARVPFAGGLLYPYIVLPRGLIGRLRGDEREAVIEHELGHIRYFDVALLVPLTLLCELFWFVPGVTWSLNRLRARLEQRADDCAVAAGIAPETVVTALVTAAEFRGTSGPVPLLAMSRGPTTLRARVSRLLAPAPVRVVSPWFSIARTLLLLWLVLGTLQASACGNHP
jgi:Zn-dependent protease with chaperone function